MAKYSPSALAAWQSFGMAPPADWYLPGEPGYSAAPAPAPVYQPPPPPAPPPPSYTGTYAAPGQTSIGQPGGFQYGLTDLGQQIAAQNYTPPQMTSGGNYTFDWNQVGKNPTIAVNNNGESNANNQEANPTWQQFTANDGTPLLGAQGANGLEVQKAIDLGGTGFTGQKLSLMNGLPYDVYGANGTLNSTGTRSGYTDDGVGDALGVGSILAMPFAAAAAGLGAGAAGTGAAGVAGGMGGVAEAGYGAGMIGAGEAGALGGGAAGLAGGGLAGEVLPKAVLDGTTAFGANSAAGAYALPEVAAGAGGTAAMGAGAGTGTMPSLPLMSTADTLAELPMLPEMAPTAALPGLPSIPPVSPTSSPPAAPPAAAPPGVPPPANPNVTDPTGVPPPANPNVTTPGNGTVNIPGIGDVPTSMLGTITSLLGGLAGSQSGAGGAGAGGTLDPRMEPYLYGSGGLLPQTQATLNQQQPLAQGQAAQMASVGGGLLGRPIAGNGTGQVTLNAPTTNTNPYLQGQADDIQRRTTEMLGQNNLSIQGNFVGSGGLGGSRQGVAQGVAAGKAADYLSGNLANMFGTQYNNDQNRAVTQYGMDQNFYTQNRQQDLSGAQLGGSLLGQSQSQAFAPLTSAGSVYGKFSGLNSGQDSGFNWSGLAGGLLGGAQLAKNAGWWS